MKYNLFTETSAKIEKSAQAAGGQYYSVILYLAPHKASGHSESLCPHATPECIQACLGPNSGHGIFANVREARKRRALLYFSDKEKFFDLVRADMGKAQAKAKRLGKRLVVRLDGTSDRIAEDFYNDMAAYYADVIFYDYTKNQAKMKDYLAGRLPRNYHVTFSYTQQSEAFAKWVLMKGGQVATVFSSPLPESFLGYPVHNGDEHDLTFLQPKGVILGLSIKGNEPKRMQPNAFIQIGRG